MAQTSAEHINPINLQSRNCTVESPQSQDSPTTMFSIFPTPTQKKGKGSSWILMMTFNTIINMRVFDIPASVISNIKKNLHTVLLCPTHSLWS